MIIEVIIIAIIVFICILCIGVYAIRSHLYKFYTFYENYNELKVNIPMREGKLIYSKLDNINYNGENLVKQYQTIINKWISNLVNTDEFGENDELKNICQYAIKDGKRIRAIVALEICRMNTGHIYNYVDLALAIEYIHNSSLIIDDMEYFDNDLFRRNNMSVHYKYGNANAHMASLILLVSAFKNISRQFSTLSNPFVQNYLIYFINNELQQTAIGQTLDTINNSNVIDIIIKKTSTLFEISCVCGWLFSGGSLIDIVDIKKIGTSIGLCLQLADDLSDMEKDKKLNHTNYANIYGIDKTHDLIIQNINNTKNLLIKHNLDSNVWTEIFKAILNMIYS